MAKLTINVGANPNDGTGDPLRVAGQKINSNFSELYITSQLAYGQANTGSSLGLSAYNNSIQANTTAQLAYDQANTANNLAQSSFNFANTNVTLATFKTVVANSTDFADFQTRVAAL